MSDAAVEPVTVGELRVEADLNLSVDGAPVRLRSADGRIEVSVDRPATLRRLDDVRTGIRALWPDGHRDPLTTVPVGIHVDGVEVARIDPGSPAGPLARVLGASPARLDLRGVVRAALKRLR
ncbi:hypothetical protein Hbl1158_11340 [Halobaculum sp. CBA1158]|uniref:hypothetical protein n=1 Tax=Halobaculum sp. CBA1158 TaxID=2904243 RepID=UPI001F41EB04|nr:hypothetical protein [Halobaculum sp. CBA1158]UIO99124.1 hypothetical protein Hbl1158_11340 [Halobaculum sp. CBA1158]